MDDLHAMLNQGGAWVELGAADEQKPTNVGPVEAWGALRGKHKRPVASTRCIPWFLSALQRGRSTLFVRQHYLRIEPISTSNLQSCYFLVLKNSIKSARAFGSGRPSYFMRIVGENFFGLIR